MHGREPGNFFLSVVNVFDLGQIPPREIAFKPELLDEEGIWSIESAGDTNYLKFSKFSSDYSVCQSGTVIHYQWNGRVIEPVFIEDFSQQSDACIDLKMKDLWSEANWGNQKALDTLLTLVDGYP